MIGWLCRCWITQFCVTGVLWTCSVQLLWEKWEQKWRNALLCCVHTMIEARQEFSCFSLCASISDWKVNLLVSSLLHLWMWMWYWIWSHKLEWSCFHMWYSDSSENFEGDGFSCGTQILFHNFEGSLFTSGTQICPKISSRMVSHVVLQFCPKISREMVSDVVLQETAQSQVRCL